MEENIYPSYSAEGSQVICDDPGGGYGPVLDVASYPPDAVGQAKLAQDIAQALQSALNFGMTLGE